MDTDNFVKYLEKEVIKGNEDIAKQIRMQDWIFGVGIPDNCPKVRSVLFEKVDSALVDWKKYKKADSLETKNWSSHEWLHFLRHLPKEMTIEDMKILDKAFGFTESGNSELQAAWYVHCIHKHYTPAYKALENFLMSVGRRKFLTPLYTAMSKYPDMKKMAIEIYGKAKKGYHSLAVMKTNEILGLK